MSLKNRIRRGLAKSFSGIWIVSLAVLTLLTLTITAGDVFAATSLSWTAPTTNTDGTPLTDLSGYKVYYRTASNGYSELSDVGSSLNYIVTSLPDGTYYFAVTAYDTSRIESDYSNEVTRTITTQYTLTITNSGTGSGVVTSSPSGLNCGTACSALYNTGSVVTLTATPSGNSTFAGWAGGGCTGSGTCSFTISANKAVTATFSAQAATYTIAASAGTGGSVTPSGTTTVTSGGSQTYTITPSTGYTIASVLVDGVSVGAVSNYTFSGIAANHIISATFSAQAATYTIAASAGTGGSVTPSGTTTVTSGGSQTYTITPSTGYTIASVLVDGVSVGAVSNYTFSGIAANHIISATFSAQAATYTITASAGTGGSVTPSGTATVTSGGSQTYTIAPAAGYSISSVLADGVSVGDVSSYTFSSVKANHTISATFSAQAVTYTITASAGTGGSVTPSGTATVTSGGSQTYTITPSTGYSIASVLVDGVSVGAVTSYAFSSVAANHTVSASFAENAGGSATITLKPASDTFINVDSSNNSSSAQLSAYTWPAGQVANAMLMKFDLSSIPANATIQSATLNLYLLEADTDTSHLMYNISLYRIANHNPDLSKATGYTYDGTNAWTANTNCYDNVPLAQADISAAYDVQAVNQTKGFKTWNATQLIQDWLANPAYNYGLMLNSDTSAPSDTYRLFASSKNATASYLPYLTVTYSSGVTSYTITASAGTGGSVTPSGTATVTSGGSQTYTITPSTGYSIASVLVDGVSVGAVSSYTFSSVKANHTISATFSAQAVTYTITASAGTGGSVTPSGTATVNSGSSQAYTITPATGYSISSVKVDGVSVGAVGSYTFSSVKANHTIAATFAVKTYTIKASAGTGGSISPSGTKTISSGGSQTYTITPGTRYSISKLTVDGVSVGAVGSYTFSAVKANHTITATFKRK